MATDSEWFEGKRYHRKTCLPISFWIGVIALTGCFLYGAKAFADTSFQAKDGSVKYVRHSAQCEDADILKYLLAMGAGHLIDQFKKGTLTYGGREWRSCWIEMQETVFSVDEEGSPLEPIPATLFKQVGQGA